MKNKCLWRDAGAAQRKVPAELVRSPAARTPDGVLDRVKMAVALFGAAVFYLIRNFRRISYETKSLRQDAQLAERKITS